MLIAPCHRGSFFEDMGNLVDGPVSQQIPKGTYDYPEDLYPATRFLFEEAAHTYSSLTPQEIAIYVTPEDCPLFWEKAREYTGSPIVAYILFATKLHHSVQTCLICMLQNCQSVQEMEPRYYSAPINCPGFFGFFPPLLGYFPLSLGKIFFFPPYDSYS